MRKVIILVSLFIVALDVQAGPARPLVFRIEQSGKQLQQLGLAFHQDKLVSSINSNFVCRPVAEIFLGEMERPLNDFDRASRDFFSPFQRKRGETLISPVLDRLESKTVSPHELRFMLGADNVTAGRKFEVQALRLASLYCKERYGKEHSRYFKNGHFISLDRDKIKVEVWKSGKMTSTRVLEVKNHCQPHEGTKKCLIPEAGQVWLR